MQKYGILQNGELMFVSAKIPGAKPIRHAEIPEFDQLTQAVFAGQAVDRGDYIYVDVMIREVEQDDSTEMEYMF